MTKEEIIIALNELYLEQMRMETISRRTRSEISLLIDKIKADILIDKIKSDATTTINA